MKSLHEKIEIINNKKEKLIKMEEKDRWKTKKNLPKTMNSASSTS